MMCEKCHDVEGPFICNVQTNRCLCEDCYMFEDIVGKTATFIRRKSRVKETLSMTAVSLMDSIETAVFDELGIK